MARGKSNDEENGETGMNVQERIPTVGILVYKEGKVLLVKHREGAKHLTGVYGLPAGRLQEGEDFSAAAARELEEETGLKTEASQLIRIPTVYEAEIPRKGGEMLKTSWHVFVAKEYSGELKASDETIPEWVKINEISKLDLLPNTEKAAREGLEI
ncbi:MAG: NUDIX domain-containing protein [bacterium]|nr:NUDIX domain-containing protein [bacterium]